MNENKKYKWHKIAASLSELHFNENNLLQLEIGGNQICIANTANGLAACAAKCPHAAGIMASGFINKNENIICPIHRYSFNLKTGRDTMGEGYYLKIYPIKEIEGEIFIGIEEKGFFSWLK